MAALCRHIEAAEQPATLEELARHAGISSYNLHRLFKAATGLTPRAYANAHRTQRVQQQQRVWQALRAIPPGHTASYVEIAKRIGAPTSARAVAQACSANALA